ncbi:hypothetical protein GCM10010404_25410 [Nonomuraea africana]
MRCHLWQSQLRIVPQSRTGPRLSRSGTRRNRRTTQRRHTRINEPRPVPGLWGGSITGTRISTRDPRLAITPE